MKIYINRATQEEVKAFSFNNYYDITNTQIIPEWIDTHLVTIDGEKFRTSEVTSLYSSCGDWIVQFKDGSFMAYIEQVIDNKTEEDIKRFKEKLDMLLE